MQAVGGSRRTPDADGSVGVLTVRLLPIFRGMNRHALEAELATGTRGAQSNLPPIGDKNSPHRLLLTGVGALAGDPVINDQLAKSVLQDVLFRILIQE